MSFAPLSLEAVVVEVGLPSNQSGFCCHFLPGDGVDSIAMVPKTEQGVVESFCTSSRGSPFFRAMGYTVQVEGA